MEANCDVCENNGISLAVAASVTRSDVNKYRLFGEFDAIFETEEDKDRSQLTIFLQNLGA